MISLFNVQLAFGASATPLLRVQATIIAAAGISLAENIDVGG
jgi:hypothetical protein